MRIFLKKPGHGTNILMWVEVSRNWWLVLLQNGGGSLQEGNGADKFPDWHPCTKTAFDLFEC